MLSRAVRLLISLYTLTFFLDLNSVSLPALQKFIGVQNSVSQIWLSGLGFLLWILGIALTVVLTLKTGRLLFSAFLSSLFLTVVLGAFAGFGHADWGAWLLIYLIDNTVFILYFIPLTILFLLVNSFVNLFTVNTALSIQSAFFIAVTLYTVLAFILITLFTRLYYSLLKVELEREKGLGAL